MAARIRDCDWAATPLGPINRWPQNLKTVVDVMLSSPSMMSLVWGAEAIHLYNDGFAELLREHHAETLGQSAYETFARTRDVFAADVAAGMLGKSARLLSQRYPVLRHGQLTDAWFDVDYAPVREETGKVVGVLWTLNETTSQVLAERALRESEARNRLLIGSWAQAVWETDPDGIVVTDSPSWRAYTGQTLEEWLGYGWLDAIHPDDRAYAEQQWREATAAGSPVDAEFRLRASEGGWRWTNVRAAPVIDARGEIVKWAGMNIDIDASKRAEAALRESEERYRRLFTSMDEAYAVVEVLKDGSSRWTDFRFVEVNPAFIAHTGMPYPVGRTATELLGKPNPRWTQLYGDALDSGRAIRVEETERTLDRVFDLNIFTLDREINRVAVLFTNVTERKNAEEALRASEELRRLALESGGMGAWRWNVRERTIWADEAFQKLWGVSFGDQLHPLSTYTERMGAQGAASLETVMRVGTIPGQEIQNQVQVTAGPTAGRWIQWRGRAEQDEPWIINGVGFDITEQRMAEQKLRGSEERLRSAVEVGRLGLWDWDVVTGRVHWSDEHFRMEGYAVGEVTPTYETWAARIYPDDRPDAEAALHDAMNQRTEFAHEFRVVHPDKSIHWLLGRGKFFYDDHGRPIRMVGAMVETTERREWEDRQQVLVAELQHRTRNLMGVVRSIADKTVRASADLSDFRARFRDRLEALSRVQGLLSRLREHDRVTFDELIETELAALGGGADRIRLEGPRGVRLRSTTVQTLAMALHELATNAVKYGALSQASGQLGVAWRLAPDASNGSPWLHIDWRESGVEMPPVGSTPSGSGQGRELIERALPYQLSARTSYELGPDGVRCAISIPVSATTPKGAEHA